MQQHYTFNMDAPEYQACSYFDDCSNKRMAMCAYLEPLSISIAENVFVSKYDRGVMVKIGLDMPNKNTLDEIYKSIGAILMEGC